MKNKFLSYIKLPFLFSIIFSPIALISCSTSTQVVKKDFKQWGSNNFVRNYSKLSYENDFKNAKLVNEIDYKRSKPSNSTYQLLVYSFADGNNDGIGDFIGASKKLLYIKSLGFDQIWLSPIHPASSYHGYDVIDYTAVAQEFGGMEAFDSFLKEAHQMNIKVYLDMVFNHTSYAHPWFQEAIKNKNSKYRNYYNFFDENNNLDGSDLGKIDKNTANKYVNLANPQIPKKEYIAKFWSGMPDLNLDNPDVIHELENVQNFWIKKGIDGFRYDAIVEYFSSKGETQNNYNTKKILADFRESIKKKVLNRNKNFDPYLFGEWWGGPMEARKYYYDGSRRALDSAYDGSHWRGNPFITISLDETKKITKKYSENINSNETWMPFLGNHDQNRWLNSYFNKIENINPTNYPKTLTQKEINASSTALFSLLTRPANPIVWQGDELAYHGRKSPNDAALREPMNWSDNNYNINFYERRSGEKEKIKIGISNDRPHPIEQLNNSNQPAFWVKKLNKWRSDNNFVSKTSDKTISSAINCYDLIKGNLGNIFIRENTNKSKKFLVGFTMETKAEIKIKSNKFKIIISSHNNKINDNILNLKANSFFIFEIL